MDFSACLSCTTHWYISTCPLTPRCKTFSSFLISIHVFLCTELIFNYTLVVQLALNLSMASKFGSNLKYDTDFIISINIGMFSATKVWFATMKISHSMCCPHKTATEFWPSKAFRLDIAGSNQPKN